MLVSSDTGRHLEIRPLVSGLERCPGCHPERSEGSLRQASEILRCAQDDSRGTSPVRSREALSPNVYPYRCLLASSIPGGKETWQQLWVVLTKSVQSKDCYGTLCYSYEYMHGEEK